MEKKSSQPRPIGMVLQVPSIPFLLFALLKGEIQLAIIWAVMLLLGIGIYLCEPFSWLNYLHDWVVSFLFITLDATLVGFFLLFNHEIGFPIALLLFCFYALISFGLFKLLSLINRKRKLRSSGSPSLTSTPTPPFTEKPAMDSAKRVKKLADELNAAAPVPMPGPASVKKPVADSAKQVKNSPHTINTAAPASATPPISTSPTARTSASSSTVSVPMQHDADMVERRISSLADSLEHDQQKTDDFRACMAKAADQDELYAIIDSEAAQLPPSDRDCYTAAGQRSLLDIATRTLPQLSLLCTPDLPGDRLQKASNGEEAYEALLSLTKGMTGILKALDRAHLQETLSGISRNDALMAWKTFRFYWQFADNDIAFSLLFLLLSDMV